MLLTIGIRSATVRYSGHCYPLCYATVLSPLELLITICVRLSALSIGIIAIRLLTICVADHGYPFCVSQPTLPLSTLIMIIAIVAPGSINCRPIILNLTLLH